MSIPFHNIVLFGHRLVLDVEIIRSLFNYEVSNVWTQCSDKMPHLFFYTDFSTYFRRIPLNLASKRVRTSSFSIFIFRGFSVGSDTIPKSNSKCLLNYTLHAFHVTYFDITLSTSARNSHPMHPLQTLHQFRFIQRVIVPSIPLLEVIKKTRLDPSFQLSILSSN